MVWKSIRKPLNFQLWDFGGQERFRFFLDSFVMGANAAILMFDLTRVSSLENLDEWVDICRKYDPNLPILLVGSKLDLEEMISVDMEDALKMKEKHHCIDFLKVSSKSGHNVHKVFELLTYYLFNKNQLKDKVAIQT
ncbi:MAG: GTP-binding protein [Promethearchaeota archaeon]|nr:MAG: GTP-binding protein [Candidatus Lokiarchaeota archaeon]